MLPSSSDTSSNNKRNLFEGIEKCIAFKKSLLDISRHTFYSGLHENVEIKKSVTKGHYAAITKNIGAFEILGCAFQHMYNKDL